MAWGSPVTSTALTLTDTYQVVQSGGGDMVVTMNPRERATVEIHCNFQATPTDNAEWQIQISSDGGSNWSIIPFHAGTLLRTADPNSAPVIVEGCERWRVRGRQTGATDTTNSMTIRYTLDGVSA